MKVLEVFCGETDMRAYRCYCRVVRMCATRLLRLQSNRRNLVRLTGVHSTNPPIDHPLDSNPWIQHDRRKMTFRSPRIPDIPLSTSKPEHPTRNF